MTVSRKLNKDWTVNAGVTTASEQIFQENATHDYTLVAVPLSVSYDSTDLKSPLDDPRHGMRDSISVAPTRSLGQTSATFIISQLKVAAYYDLQRLFDASAGRSVLAARALVGFAQGAGTFSLPPDQRFYGGGSGTIRGYRYQSVGPQFPRRHSARRHGDYRRQPGVSAADRRELGRRGVRRRRPGELEFAAAVEHVLHGSRQRHALLHAHRSGAIRHCGADQTLHQQRRSL